MIGVPCIHAGYGLRCLLRSITMSLTVPPTECACHYQTKDLARSANLLVNKHSGRTGSYGLVLENLLAAKGPAFHPATKKEKDEKGHREGDGVGSGNSLASPTAMHSSSVLHHSTSVSSSAVLNKGDPHHTISTKSPTHASTHVNTASTDNGRRHSGHSRSSSPINL